MGIFREKNWALSRDNRPIELVTSFDLKGGSAIEPVLIIGGVHGDEPEGVLLASALLNWLETEKVAVPWAIIPCINPDGYATNSRVNGAGVDLNRNYPASNWSTQHNEPRYNPGPSPGSEPEIQALVALIKSQRPRLVIHCHSWEPCVVYTGEPALKDAEYLAQSSGYRATTTIGYPTPGSLSYWGWHDHGIPVICIEEAERVGAADTWNNFAQGFAQILNDDTRDNPRNRLRD